MAGPDELTTLFGFEDDLGGRLACLPMAVRFKLDAAGIKLHLKEWVNLAEEDRRALLDWPCAGAQDVAAFGRRVAELARARTGRDPDTFAPPERPAWEDPAVVPEEVRARVEALGARLPVARWAALSPLRRFVLVKLSRPKHDAEKLRPALQEFGVL